MRRKQPQWKLMIDWYDESSYLQLDERVRDDLDRFRRITTYINKLQKSVERDELIIKKLQSDIKKRREKIRLHNQDGKPIYERLEYLKSEHDIDVYYTEGTTTKMVNKGGYYKTKEPRKYTQTNLKYKSKFINNPKTIYLKSNRRELLNTLKDVCPQWYDRVGKSLTGETKITKVKMELVKLFKPVIKELIDKNKKKLNDKNYTITLDKMLEVVREK